MLQAFAPQQDKDEWLQKSKQVNWKHSLTLGRGGGQVVSVLAFYANDPS